MAKSERTKARTGGTGQLRSSLNKWAIYTLIALSVACLIGVLVPQVYVQIQPDQVRHLVHESPWLKVPYLLGFFDVFNSWWFRLLVVLLVGNLIVCSSLGLARVFRQKKERDALRGRAVAKTMKTVGTIEADGDRAEAIARDWARRFGRVHERDAQGVRVLYAERGWTSRLGVYVVHASVVLIAVGAMVGNLVGFRAHINIAEGTTENRIRIDKSATDEVATLPFAIRCNRFEVEYYPGTGQPKEFRSDLTVVENGRDVVSKTIEVNDPLEYAGYRFFQANYGEFGGRTTVHATDAGSGELHEMTLADGVFAEVPGSKTKLRVIDFRDNQMNSGPAIRVEIEEGGDAQAAWLFRDAPDFDAQRGGKFVFRFLDRQPGYYTGLSIQKDPGIPIVWTGFVLMFVGMLMVYGYAHRRGAAVIDGETVTLAAASSRRSDVLDEDAGKFLREQQSKGA